MPVFLWFSTLSILHLFCLILPIVSYISGIHLSVRVSLRIQYCMYFPQASQNYFGMQRDWKTLCGWAAKISLVSRWFLWQGNKEKPSGHSSAGCRWAWAPPEVPSNLSDSEIPKNTSGVMSLRSQGENSSAVGLLRTSQVQLCRPSRSKVYGGGEHMWLRAGEAFRLNGVFLLPHWWWRKPATALVKGTAQLGKNWPPPMLLCSLLVYKS